MQAIQQQNPTQPQTVLRSFRHIDEVEHSLVDAWCAVSKATHDFLVLLREFDLRQGWKAYGSVDCADWLNWKCGINRCTAQEKVRVARALWSLPQIDAAFEEGALSYSKVRALTRVANDCNETDLLDYALDASASQIEDYCRRLRNGDAEASARDAVRLHESRSLTRHFREDGSGTISVALPEAELTLVMQALEQVAGTLPKDESSSLFARGADALVQMARETLAGRQNGNGSASHQVVVHVDADALVGNGGQSDLPVSTVRRLCCDGSIVALVENADGQPMSVGRSRRTVTPSMRTALLGRDRKCTFPGCHHEQYLDAHHVVHWADEGETSLENLVLLCSHHHTLIHEVGFGMRQHRDGAYYFVRTDGRPVEVGGRPQISFSAEDEEAIGSSASCP